MEEWKSPRRLDAEAAEAEEARRAVVRQSQIEVADAYADASSVLDVEQLTWFPASNRQAAVLAMKKTIEARPDQVLTAPDPAALVRVLGMPELVTIEERPNEPVAV